MTPRSALGEYIVERGETGSGPGVIWVAIVDDDPRHRGYLRSRLMDLSNSGGEQFRIREFESGAQFLETQREAFDIVLLDVAMPGIDGLATAQAIRAHDRETVIIFVTQNVDAATRGYAVAALGYLVKPVKSLEFMRVLHQAITTIRGSRRVPSFVIHTVDGLARVSARDVRYLESRGHHVLMHVAGTSITASGTIQKMEAQLASDGFVRCHRSVLVNLRYIERVGATECVVVGGTNLPVSRGRRRELLEAMTTWFGALAG